MALLPYPIKLLLSELPTFLDLATSIFFMFHNLFGYLSSFFPCRFRASACGACRARVTSDWADHSRRSRSSLVSWHLKLVLVHTSVKSIPILISKSEIHCFYPPNGLFVFLNLIRNLMQPSVVIGCYIIIPSTGHMFF